MFEHRQIAPLSSDQYELIRLEAEIDRLHVVLDGQSSQLAAQELLLLLFLVAPSTV